MKIEHITKGSIIDTFFGTIEVTGYNGSIVYGIEREYDEEGNVEREEETRLTLNEIGHMMKEVDGRNHKVWYDEEEENEE